MYGTDLDQFRVVGVETSVCYIGWLGPVETEDSILTGILRKLGAVFYGTPSSSSADGLLKQRSHKA